MSITIKSLKSLTMSMMTKAVRLAKGSFGEALRYCYKVARKVMEVAHLYGTIEAAIEFAKNLIAVNGGATGTVTFFKVSDGTERVIECTGITLKKGFDDLFLVQIEGGWRSFRHSTMISFMVA